MDISPFIDHNINIITRFNAHSIYVNDQLIDYDIILSPNSIDKWVNIFKTHEPERYEAIINKIKDGLYGDKPIVIIGSNSITQALFRAIRQLFAMINISPEVMPSKSAYKTYNILASEGRAVIAILEIAKYINKQ